MQDPQDSIKSNQLYAAAFLLENYLKLIPDQSILENIICRQVQRRQAPRGIWDMLDFYSVLGDFWDKYGAHYGELNWVKMYDVYSDNAKFKNMFKKKQKQVNIIWKGQGLPTKKQMKDIINHLTNHPEKKTQIAAVVEVLNIRSIFQTCSFSDRFCVNSQARQEGTECRPRHSLTSGLLW